MPANLLMSDKEVNECHVLFEYSMDWGLNQGNMTWDEHDREDGMTPVKGVMPHFTGVMLSSDCYIC